MKVLYTLVICYYVRRCHLCLGRAPYNLARAALQYDPHVEEPTLPVPCRWTHVVIGILVTY